MRENIVFVKNIDTFFLKCIYFSNSFAIFEQLEASILKPSKETSW